MSYTIIAAIGKNRELGKNNDLIWHLPGDLKFFKETTTGHSIIMGRKTLESLPRLLPNRHHIVLSSKDDFSSEIEHYKTMKELLNNLKDRDEEFFIIGGGSIYKEFILLADKLLIDPPVAVRFPVVIVPLTLALVAVKLPLLSTEKLFCFNASSIQ